MSAPGNGPPISIPLAVAVLNLSPVDSTNSHWGRNLAIRRHYRDRVTSPPVVGLVLFHLKSACLGPDYVIVLQITERAAATVPARREKSIRVSRQTCPVFRGPSPFDAATNRLLKVNLADTRIFLCLPACILPLFPGRATRMRRCGRCTDWHYAASPRLKSTPGLPIVT